jgi:hypothetical protein
MSGKTGNEMDEIKSKINGTVLHIIFRQEDFEDGRKDIVNYDNFIQVAALKLDEGKNFRPHKHILKKGAELVWTQEGMIVIKGKVKCVLYDINDKILETPILHAGDISITLQAGHTYEVMKDSLIYEIKTGPYYGQVRDKVFIDETDR